MISISAVAGFPGVVVKVATERTSSGSPETGNPPASKFGDEIVVVWPASGLAKAIGIVTAPSPTMTSNTSPSAIPWGTGGTLAPTGANVLTNVHERMSWLLNASPVADVNPTNASSCPSSAGRSTMTPRSGNSGRSGVSAPRTSRTSVLPS